MKLLPRRPRYTTCTFMITFSGWGMAYLGLLQHVSGTFHCTCALSVCFIGPIPIGCYADSHFLSIPHNIYQFTTYLDNLEMSGQFTAVEELTRSRGSVAEISPVMENRVLFAFYLVQHYYFVSLIVYFW